VSRFTEGSLMQMDVLAFEKILIGHNILKGFAKMGIWLLNDATMNELMALT
jgi:hypothetical protein